MNVKQKTNYKGEAITTFTSQNNRKSTRGRRIQYVKNDDGMILTRIIHHPNKESVKKFIEGSVKNAQPESLAKPTINKSVKKNFLSKLFNKKGR